MPFPVDDFFFLTKNECISAKSKAFSFDTHIAVSMYFIVQQHDSIL